MGQRRRAEDACARLLEIRTPGWRAEWRPQTGLYHAARVNPRHAGDLIPPFLAHANPSALDAEIRQDGTLTAELRAGLYGLQDEGKLPVYEGPPASA
ncbi:hypothetical protein HDA32_003191 [Spinactinospora alkalitolerans]|uniref:Uncharacterized protein n=1 Tax=Spinactinospora alkalitolerans TaxID=687207 RepID=A0A852TWG1_9ACTN|nr:hypothetical protein [Spinactinospora alkalitolerans]